MQNLNEGLLFDPALSAEIKDRFYYVDADPNSASACSLKIPAVRCA